MYPYPLQRADVLALIRELLRRADMQGEARKKYTTSSLNDQRNSKIQKSSKQQKKTGDYWSFLHFYILPRKKAFLLNWGSV